MSTTTGADERRKHIIQEAATLFNKSGYFHTSMEDIAEAVGLRKPTLYYYVSSKEEILFLIHEEFVDQLISHHQSRLNSRMTCAQLLQEVLIDILEEIAQFPGYVRAFFEHYGELNGDMKKQIKDKRDSYYRMMVDVVRQGVTQGEFQTNDPNLTVFAFLGMCNYAYQWYKPEGHWRSREIALHFWDIFMHGVSRPVNDNNSVVKG